MVSPLHPSWFFLGMLPLESLPWGLLLHLASCRAVKRPGNYSKEVQGKCGERAPRRGRQLCQEALRRSQMGRGALRPRAEPGLEVSTADSAWGLPLASPLAGPQGRTTGGFKESGIAHPACFPTAGSGVILWSAPWCLGRGLPQGVADPASPHPPANPWPGRQGHAGLWGSPVSPFSGHGVGVFSST